MTGRWLIAAVAVTCFAGLGLAAAGAHLVPDEPAGPRSMWAVASQIHLFHAAALLAVAVLAETRRSVAIARTAALILTGAVLFSGTLYLKALGIFVVPGPFTPLGGILALAGWAALAVILIRKKSN